MLLTKEKMIILINLIDIFVIFYDIHTMYPLTFLGENVMTLFMRRLLLYGVCAEIILFFLLYYFGSNGTHVLAKLALEKKQLIEEIELFQREVDQLDQKIKQARTPFAKEKIARERLLMKKKDEKIYFLKK